MIEVVIWSLPKEICILQIVFRLDLCQLTLGIRLQLTLDRLSSIKLIKVASQDFSRDVVVKDIISCVSIRVSILVFNSGS